MISTADLSLFSTKTLVETNADHQVEVRTQVINTGLVYCTLYNVFCIISKNKFPDSSRVVLLTKCQ